MQCLPGECQKELQQIKISMLREGYLENEWRLETVHTDKEGGVARSKQIVLVTETKFDAATIQIDVQQFVYHNRCWMKEGSTSNSLKNRKQHTWIKSRANGNVDQCFVLTLYIEFNVNVQREGRVHEVDTRIVLVVGFGHVECVRVAGGQIVVARSLRVLGITHVIVRFIALVAVMSRDSLGGATAFARFMVAVLTLAIARAWCARTVVDWIPVKSVNTFVAVRTIGEVLARLITNIGSQGTLAMAIALARGTRAEVPFGCWTSFGLQPATAPIQYERAVGGSFQTDADARSQSIITPTTLWILQALVTRLDVGARQISALVRVDGPFHALANRVDGRVSIRFDAPFPWAAPHARALSTIFAGRPHVTRCFTSIIFKSGRCCSCGHSGSHGRGHFLHFLECIVQWPSIDGRSLRILIDQTGAFAIPLPRAMVLGGARVAIVHLVAIEHVQIGGIANLSTVRHRSLLVLHQRQCSRYDATILIGIIFDHHRFGDGTLFVWTLTTNACVIAPNTIVRIGHAIGAQRLFGTQLSKVDHGRIVTVCGTVSIAMRCHVRGLGLAKKWTSILLLVPNTLGSSENRCRITIFRRIKVSTIAGHVVEHCGVHDAVETTKDVEWIVKHYAAVTVFTKQMVMGAVKSHLWCSQWSPRITRYVVGKKLWRKARVARVVVGCIVSTASVNE